MKVKDTALSARQLKAGPDDGLEEGVFSAYASVFGNEDSYGDVVVAGAFAADLARWKESGQNIPLLFGHNMSDPDFNIGHVVDAVEDEKGLLVTAQLDLENPKAAQVYRMLKGRRINQMSFAYDVIDGGSVTEDEKSHYELRELKVYEISVVTIGANQETEILAVKSATNALLSKAGRVISAKNETALRSAHEQLVGAATEIKNVLAALDSDEEKSTRPGGTTDQEKASGESEAKSGASDEEPTAAKSTVPDEEPKTGPSVDDWATELSLLALAHRE
jgi:HK97 family phage prohead protease